MGKVRKTGDTQIANAVAHAEANGQEEAEAEGHTDCDHVCASFTCHVVFNRVPPRRTSGARRWLRDRLWAFLVTAGKKRRRLAALPMDAHPHEVEAYLRRALDRMDRYCVPAVHREKLLAALRAGPTRHGFLSVGAPAPATDDRREHARAIAARVRLI